MARAKKEPQVKAVKAGAEASTLRVQDVEETALSYMDGDVARIRIKVIGDLKNAV